MIDFYIYLLIGVFPAFFNSRIVWAKWRLSNDKTNVVLPNKMLNRLLDSAYAGLAFIISLFLWPLVITELLITVIIKILKRRMDMNFMRSLLFAVLGFCLYVSILVFILYILKP